ncbi:SPOC like C-terminal domain-containing protein [Dunaliella salina]|uniref:SPOC like C-terminal domain-containing protein n=1 Tax=Dunaliella salina TaxID=3046 RepID=A0ABQ7G821_DUNSA|nr:SPOC like C-terminal domain-containing protein [Dunaliella salina]|eukprot:KAF5830755.1 SPOC like C-terminal domain-containing protein [Dunaliella salina]
MVALLPQALETDPFGYQVSPEGMHIIPLPYADDIRMPEKQAPIVEPSADHIQYASALIDRLPYEFVLGMVPDPSLHHHFNVLEAMALNREPPTLEDSRKEDQTIVPNEDIDEQAGQELEEFKANVLGPNYVPYQGKTAAGKGTKRPRADDAGLATTYANLPWADMIRAGEAALMKRTADDLKVYLAFHRLPVSGVKKDLAARILKHACKE